MEENKETVELEPDINVIQLQRDWIFGLRTGIQNCVTHIDHDTVLYPAGSALVCHTVQPSSQKFVPLNVGANKPLAMTISDKKDILAIAYEGSSASVDVWNTETWQCTKVLTCPDMQSTCFVSLSFSSGGKMLVAQGGQPDWMVVLFSVDKGKVFTSLRLTDTQELENVTSVSFHPEDAGLISIVGHKILKLMKLHDKLLKSFGYMGTHDHMCTSQTWVDSHILLVGTSDASVLVLEDGELRRQLTISHSDIAKLSKRGDSNDKSALTDGNDTSSNHKSVTALIGFDGGFLAACGADKIFMFQKSEDIHEYFSQRLLMRVCEPGVATKVSGKGQHVINTLTISPDNKTVVAATNTGQLFINTMPVLEELQTLVFKPLHCPTHEKLVVDIDFCLWKSLVISVSEDKTLKAWNTDNYQMVFQHTFKEDIYSLAVHPTGLHLAVGLTDALRIFHIFYNSIRLYDTLNVRRCILCKFSRGGQHLASVEGNLISLHSAITMKRLATLKGHTNRITGMAWFPNDASLASSSIDGSIFSWDLQSCSVAWEIRANQCSFLTTGLFLDEKHGPVVFGGHEKTLYQVLTGQMVEEGVVAEDIITCIAFSALQSFVIIGTENGAMILLPLSNILSPKPMKIEAHTGKITKVITTRDESKVITCGEDGLVIIWKLPPMTVEHPRYAFITDKLMGIPTIPETLVSHEDIRDLQNRLVELEDEVVYLKRDKSHHLALQTKQFKVEKESIMKTSHDLSEKLMQEIETLKQEMKDLRLSQDKEISELKEIGDKAAAKEREEVKQKLLHEYSKQDALRMELEELRNNIKLEKEEWEEASRIRVEEKLHEQESMFQTLKNQLDKAQEDLEAEKAESSHLLRLVESSTEIELSQVRSELHTQLQTEYEKSSKLRDDRSKLQRQVANLEKDKLAQESRIKNLELERVQSEEKISQYSQDLASLRKEVGRRNIIIADRETTISKNRNKIEELRKIEFLQGHQSRELKSKLNPLETALEDADRNTQQLEEDITDLRVQLESRDRQVKGLNQRLQGAQAMASRKERKIQDGNIRFERLKTDLFALTKLIHQPKKLKEALKDMAENLFPQEKVGEIWTRKPTDQKVEEDPVECGDLESGRQTYNQLLKQRQLLEEALQTVQKKCQKDEKTSKHRISTLIKENSELQSTVKELQSKLWGIEDTLKQTTSLLRTHQRKAKTNIKK